jgi:hypothetical protein
MTGAMTAAADPKLIADVLVNLFGALGTLVVAHNLRRSDPHGPVTSRAICALDLVAALFLMRCLAWSTESGVLMALVDILAATTPLAGLLVAEGLLRRHAPRWVKLAILCGTLMVALFSTLPKLSPTVASVVELLVVAGGFGAVGVLLWTRDQASLTEAENSSIRRVVIAMAFLVPLIATDFRSLWPDTPLRFGAVGALLVLFFAFGPGRATNGERILSLIMFTAIAGLFAFGYLSTGHGDASGQAVRAISVGLSGLIFAALFSEALGARSERRKPADPLLAAYTREQFMAALKEHRLIGGALILAGDEIAPLRYGAFDSLIAERPILKRADVPWGRSVRDDGVERATSLFMTYDATHVMRLSQHPMRLAIFSLPQISSDIRAESEIAAAQRIGELIFSRAAAP